MTDWWQNDPVAAPSGTAAGGDWWQKDPVIKSPGMAEGIGRAFAEGVPIIGGLLNKANAATNAALAPVVDPLLPDSYDKLPEGTFGERYQHALKTQEA